MKVIRDSEKGIFLDYILTSAEVFSLQSAELSAEVTDPTGRNLGVRAKLRVAGNGLMSGGFYDLVEDLSMPEQRVVGLGIHERKYHQVLRGECAYFNWGHGDMTVRREGVDKSKNVCLG